MTRKQKCPTDSEGRPWYEETWPGERTYPTKDKWRNAIATVRAHLSKRQVCSRDELNRLLIVSHRLEMTSRQWMFFSKLIQQHGFASRIVAKVNGREVTYYCRTAHMMKFLDGIGEDIGGVGN